MFLSQMLGPSIVDVSGLTRAAVDEINDEINDEDEIQSTTRSTRTKTLLRFKA
jgi:hypothetical protein